MGILTYKELWLSVIYLIFPLSKKSLNDEVVVVSDLYEMNHDEFCHKSFFGRLLDHLVALGVNWL